MGTFTLKPSSPRPLPLGGTQWHKYIQMAYISLSPPPKKRSEAPDSLVQLMQDVGIPSHIHSDDARELT